MNKKHRKKWRNRLIDPLLVEFNGLNKNDNKRLGKKIKSSMDEVIKYYRSLLAKKDRRKLDLEMKDMVVSQYPVSKNHSKDTEHTHHNHQWEG